jgi:hypothetical protein
MQFVIIHSIQRYSFQNSQFTFPEKAHIKGIVIENANLGDIYEIKVEGTRIFLRSASDIIKFTKDSMQEEHLRMLEQMINQKHAAANAYLKNIQQNPAFAQDYTTGKLNRTSILPEDLQKPL